MASPQIASPPIKCPMSWLVVLQEQVSASPWVTEETHFKHSYIFNFSFDYHITLIECNKRKKDIHMYILLSKNLWIGTLSKTQQAQQCLHCSLCNSQKRAQICIKDKVSWPQVGLLCHDNTADRTLKRWGLETGAQILTWWDKVNLFFFQTNYSPFQSNETAGPGTCAPRNLRLLQRRPTPELHKKRPRNIKQEFEYKEISIHSKNTGELSMDTETNRKALSGQSWCDLTSS